MTTALEKTLQSLSKKTLTKGELAMGVQYLTGAVKCLLEMRMEVLREGGNINESINQGAGGWTQSPHPKYTPVRIR